MPSPSFNVTNNNPNPMANSLRQLAALLEDGRLEWIEGGLVIDLTSNPHRVSVRGNLVLAPVDAALAAPAAPQDAPATHMPVHPTATITLPRPASGWLYVLRPDAPQDAAAQEHVNRPGQVGVATAPPVAAAPAVLPAPVAPHEGEPSLDERDGEISLDWRTADNSILSIAIMPDGSAVFASWSDHGAIRSHGKTNLSPAAYAVLRKAATERTHPAGSSDAPSLPAKA